jgi:hypothetical protein
MPKVAVARRAPEGLTGSRVAAHWVGAPLPSSANAPISRPSTVSRNAPVRRRRTCSRRRAFGSPHRRVGRPARPPPSTSRRAGRSRSTASGYGEWTIDGGENHHDYSVVGNLEFLSAPASSSRSGPRKPSRPARPARGSSPSRLSRSVRLALCLALEAFGWTVRQQFSDLSRPPAPGRIQSASVRSPVLAAVLAGLTDAPLPGPWDCACGLAAHEPLISRTLERDPPRRVSRAPFRAAIAPRSPARPGRQFVLMPLQLV